MREKMISFPHSIVRPVSTSNAQTVCSVAMVDGVVARLFKSHLSILIEIIVLNEPAMWKPFMYWTCPIGDQTTATTSSIVATRARIILLHMMS